MQTTSENKPPECPSHCEGLAAVERRLNVGSGRMQSIEASMTTMAKKLSENTEATGEVLEILRAAKSFFKFATVTGKFIKWVFGIAAPIVAVWFALKNGAHGG